MKWIHLSDLHFDPLSDGRSTEQMRDKLKDYIKEHQITAEHMFLTGDYRNAKYGRKDIEELAKTAADFILDIAAAAKIDRKNIHVIPGNHDLDRTSDTDRIEDIRNSYDVDKGIISEEDLTFLLERFAFFKCLCHELDDRGVTTVWSEKLSRLHPYICFDDFSLLYLNTCIICNSDEDRGKLIIGNCELYRSLEELKKENPDKPIIILAHHAMENLDNDEKRTVEGLLSDYPVRLYLCGDAHMLWGRRNDDVLEITMGCLIREKQSCAAFSVGEINGCAVSVEAHKWEIDAKNPDWTPFTIFNDEFKRNGAEVITKLYPVSPDINFLGREEKINEIEHALFHDNRMLLLYGMGGIGKTEICRNIFERYQNGTSIVKKFGWITYQGSIEDSFWKQFPMLNTEDKKLPSVKKGAKKEDDTSNVRDKEVYWNEAKELIGQLGKELLLFIDNANDIKQQEILKLERLNCRLLLTSRSSMEGITCINIDHLTEEDCLRLYYRHNKDVSPSDDIVIKKIIALAARHTLLIELLAKLQYATGQTAEQMYQRLCEKGFDLSDVTENISYLHNPEIDLEGKWDKQFTDHVKILFDISGICSKKEEMEILQFFACGASGCAVPMKTVQTWMGLTDLNHLNALIKEGWLNRGTKNGVPTVEMHPMVSSAVFDMPKPTKEQVTVWYKNIADDIRIKENETAKDKLDFMPFVCALMKELPIYTSDHLELLGNAAGVYMNNSDYTKALSMYKSALEMARSIFGEKHVDVAKIYNAIGCVYDGLRDYPEALSWSLRGCEMLEELLGDSHTDTAASYCNVAGIYLKCGRPFMARRWLDKAFSIQEALPDRDRSSNTVIIYAAKGMACCMTLRFKKAIDWYEQAVEIQENIGGKEHPVAMEIYGNIGKIYELWRKYDDALEIYDKVRKVQEERRGEKHLNTTSIYRNIGNVYKKKRDYPSALTWYEKALKIREELLGEEDIRTAILYNDFGVIYYKQRNYPKALEYFTKALLIDEKKLGAANRQTKIVCMNLTETYLGCGRFLKAFEYWAKIR